MGVSGAAGILQKYGKHFGQWQTVKDIKLIVDVTDGMHWFVKRNPLKPERSDLYGSSMVALAGLYRDLFKRLRERGITPIVVYNGGRVSEEGYGQVASKHQFMERSSRNALQNVAQRKFRYLESLPTLAQNAIKEVINEFNLELVYQAPFEVYPLLERLARQHKCPVLTSHSDFIFTNNHEGFFWFDKFELPADSTGSLRGCLYRHDQMVSYFSRTPVEGVAMKSLYALLRDDFCETHYNAINKLFNLNGIMQLAPRRNKLKTQRLLHILNHWPKHLDSAERVRSSLMAIPNRQVSLERDYRGIMESFTNDDDFSQSNLSKAFVPAEVSDFNKACTRRESSASFLMELRQRNTFNRLQTVEDLRTTRSTFSLADRTKQYLLSRLHEKSLNLFDRRRGDASFRVLRELQPSAGLTDNRADEQMTCSQLFELYHFDDKTLESVAGLLQELHIDSENSKRLALMLLLARFGYKLAFRENFDNENRKLAPKKTSPSAAANMKSESSSAGGVDASAASTYLTADKKLRFFSAIVNSYVYHSSERQGDMPGPGIPAEIRVAKEKMNSMTTEPMQGLGDEQYFTIKHMIEMLNMSLHSYKELNSLYNFVGPNVLVNKYYDGVLIYRLMRKWSNNLRGLLLVVDGPLLDILSEN